MVNVLASAALFALVLGLIVVGICRSAGHWYCRHLDSGKSKRVQECAKRLPPGYTRPLLLVNGAGIGGDEMPKVLGLMWGGYSVVLLFVINQGDQHESEINKAKCAIN